MLLQKYRNLGSEVVLDELREQIAAFAVDPRKVQVIGESEPSQASTVSNKNVLLPQVYFPYSRHSSGFELKSFVKMFRPFDVYPCVVDESKSQNASMSISKLYGAYCRGEVFSFDEEQVEKHVAKRRKKIENLNEDDSKISHKQETSKPLQIDSIDSDTADQSNLSLERLALAIHGDANVWTARQLWSTRKTPLEDVYLG